MSGTKSKVAKWRLTMAKYKKYKCIGCPTGYPCIVIVPYEADCPISCPYTNHRHANWKLIKPKKKVAR